MNNHDRQALYRMLSESMEKLERQNALFSRRETLYWRLVDWRIPCWMARDIASRWPERWLPERGLEKLPEEERARLIDLYQGMAKAQAAVNYYEFQRLAEDMEPVVEALERVAERLGK